MHTLRESIALKPAAASLRQGWARSAAGRDLPGGWALGRWMPNEPEIPRPREFGTHLNSSATPTSLQKSITGFKIVQMKIGSHLYGTATPESDLDIKAVYIPSARDILLQQVSPAMSESRPKRRGEKNTSADTDCEAFSLQRYLDLLAEGQTVALDMLFAPDWAMLEPPHALWHDIKTLAPRLMTKGTTAMVRYCRQQANKYGVKGLRVAAARAALGLLQESEQTHGGSAKLETVTDALEALAAQSEYLQNTCPLGLTQAVDVKGEQLINQRYVGHMTMKNG